MNPVNSGATWLDNVESKRGCFGVEILTKGPE